MRGDDIISLYQAISDITDRMLEAARARDWEHFCELEARGATHVQTLRSHGAAIDLPQELREQKIEIIHQILARDRSIRDITDPWMAQLAILIHSARAEHKLSRAYGAAAGN